MEDTRIIETVAANVRQARKAAGLSQEELALEAAVDRTYVSQVERGKRNITIMVLARLARAMGTTASALVADVRNLASEANGSHARTDMIKALSHYWAIPCLFTLLARYERAWGEWISLVSFT